MKFLHSQSEENHWISISDLMSVLMMVFLFISVTYMLNVTKERNAIKEIAVTYNKLQNELYDDLMEEFKNDLKQWDADIDQQTLSVRFKAPDVLFASGSCNLQQRFQSILDNFFPRFVVILCNKKYKQDIEEIRIEGHTSSEGQFGMTNEDSYFYNMELSQCRTREVLVYVLRRMHAANKEWVKERLTANGLSSSKLVVKNGIEDKEKSRRVEFRVRTNAESRMVKILSTSE
jgi:outer membrane protein OmpA-like peptidoglycan-associated protein